MPPNSKYVYMEKRRIFEYFYMHLSHERRISLQQLQASHIYTVEKANPESGVYSVKTVVTKDHGGFLYHIRQKVSKMFDFIL